MLYGYLPAIVTGFLLTAIPNWTGRLPLQGGPLAVLSAAWLAGRIAICISSFIGPFAAAAIDVSFLVLVVAAAAREIIAGRNWRNLPAIFFLFILLAGNVTFHFEDYQAGTSEFGTRLGIAAAVAFISLIGGRVIPSFTRNWLTWENPGRLPAPFGRFDKTVLLLSLLALMLWIAKPEWRATAIFMLAAGVAQSIRLGRWAGERTLRDRLVLVLHVGYAFVPLGFLMLAAAAFSPMIPRTAGIHAWTAGAIGTMTLAIMTRASLGHTGRSLKAGPLTHTIYAAVVIAAILRIAAAVWSEMMIPLLHTAGAAWIVAFWMFAAAYGPLLVRPRQAKP
jgi:uncharacterized protein involved in response to NO